jgi:di/tricarboxylate transporter
LILLFGILLWATDVLHGVHPAFVGLGLVLLAFLPGWGPLPIEALRKVNFPILIYIGAAFALGEALQTTGLGDRLARRLLSVMPGEDASVAARLAAVTFAVVPFNFLADTAVVAGTLAPVFLDSGPALGLTPLQIALSVGVGAGMVFLPYQGAPFMVAYSFRRVGMGRFALVMAALSLSSLLLLVPLNLLYWKLAGLY